MNRILIAEDEPRIAAFLKKGLEANGFTVEVASDAKMASEMVFSQEFDLILLDLGLPLKDGFILLEELRGQGLTLPIIILTARDDIKDKVAGLEGGADDYVTKPFRFEELLARIRLRLKNRVDNFIPIQTELKSGKIVLNLRSRQVYLDNQLVEISNTEFTLLEILISHKGQVMTRQQLLDHVWGYSYDPGSNIVDVYIGYLRKKVGKNTIATIRGIGYQWIA
ncbi:response regulator transcription factor [Crocosphaera chwakensis]|uniref:Two-component response regulator n=1 Tax=Crocosphaera chwakensis CCY0110 TaxID=391612 RepID=A3INP5_9CHRO|nr:response regulator transcription factor [Crocosphaera chwakensis]EAZ91943.1 two-component response regulator [Crocosphaera chwakensis CCY0110]